ncbi:MAG: 3-dehydroquinate synthase [Kiritimatiellia bacterium]
MAKEPIALDTDRISAAFAVKFAYSVHFTRHAFAPENPLLAELIRPSRPDTRPRVFAAVDAHVVAAYPALSASIAGYCRRFQLDLAREPFILPAGEAAKTGGFGIVLELVKAMLDANLDRQSYLLAIGGGSALDTAGFAASVLHRGVRLIRLPTTVLGQNDAGIGVKNGIDYVGQKNAIGTFFPPWAVVDDFALLDTLPDEAFSGGFAEAVKVAMIEDRGFFERLLTLSRPFGERKNEAVEETIRHTALLHLRHIATCGDSFETGSARPLDFGHWSAHRLEVMSGYRLGHGHAVAIGVTIDTLYAQTMGWISSEDATKTILMLKDARTYDVARRFADLLDDHPSLLRGMDDFRAHLGGPLTLTFPAPIGTHREVHEIDEETMRQAVARTGEVLRRE